MKKKIQSKALDLDDFDGKFCNQGNILHDSFRKKTVE
jgi:hypothetical protein